VSPSPCSGRATGPELDAVFSATLPPSFPFGSASIAGYDTISSGLALLLAVSLTACARTATVTTGQLPLRRVVVYRNGVGYFERAGRVDESEVKFRMRQKTIGDFLATLAIVEKGGSSVRSASFPIEVEDETEPPPEPPPCRPTPPLRCAGSRCCAVR